jgi:hypothetical protein
MAKEHCRSGGHELNESFFHMQNQQLLDEFRDHLAHLDRRAQLMDASGIHDDAVLDRLLSLEIGPERLAALTLVPLVEVAWADGQVRPAERAAVISAAEATGIRPEDDAHQLLDQWLTQKPDAQMLEGWKHYVSALCQTLDEEAARSLKHDVMDRARTVAASAGGILGFGNRISKEEREMLDELERAFEPDGSGRGW